MNITLEELSDFWQDVLYTRCKGDRRKAVETLVDIYTRYPNSSEGRFSRLLLKFYMRTAITAFDGKRLPIPPVGPEHA